MGSSFLQDMDAELFGSIKDLSPIYSPLPLYPLQPVATSSRVTTPRVPKPVANANPFSHVPARPQSLKLPVSAGPVVVFFNYHSVSVAVNKIESIFDYVEETLGRRLVRIICCCDVRFVPTTLMNFIKSKKFYEIAHCFSTSRDAFDSCVSRRIRLESAIVGQPGTAVIVTDKAALDEAFRALKKRQWTTVLFTPAQFAGPFESTADLYYPLPVSTIQEPKNYAVKKSTKNRTYATLAATYPHLDSLSPLSGCLIRGDNDQKYTADRATSERHCCPFYDIQIHRSIGCGYYHPPEKCRYFPKCEHTAQRCLYAHPFCSTMECDCDDEKDPNLNHFMA